MKRTLSILLCLLLLAALLPATVFAVTTIRSVNLTLEYPEAGKTAPGTATWHGSGYSIYAIDWMDRDKNRYLEPDEKLQVGRSYQATLWVQADSGYEFSYTDSKTPTVQVTVNGEEYEAYKAYEYNAWAMFCVDVAFPPVPEKGWIHALDITVPTPVAGELPFYGQITTSTYSLSNVYFSGSTDPNMINGISWYAGNEQLPVNQGITFQEGTAYTFHCLVFPEEGYRLNENTAVSVNGKKAKAMLDYGTFLSVNYTFPATAKPVHTHTPGAWQYDKSQHYRYCTDPACGQKLEPQAHSSGEATCQDQAVCTVCTAAYGPLGDHELITDSWTYQTDAGHAHGCQSPGCDYHDALKPHVPGPAATVSSPQLCKDCGYVIRASQDHTHSLTEAAAIAPTCTQPGRIAYYTCSGCSQLFADVQGKEPLSGDTTLAPLGHTASEEWGQDADFHWRSCTACSTVLEETKLSHGDTDSDGKCDTCGYAADAPTQPEPTVPVTTEPVATEPAPTQAEPTDPGISGQDPGQKKWLLISLVAVVCFAAAITATVLILKKRQDK